MPSETQGGDMTDKLTIFKDTTGKQVAVNPRQVRYVSQVNEDDVWIFFDKEHILVVEGTFRGVVSKLENE
jgi:hypothetical protein